MIGTFEGMKIKLSDAPVGVEQMVNQQNYVDEVMTSIMPDIEIQLDKTRKSYTLFKEIVFNFCLGSTF